ncbi:uncharacterized protein LOC110447800 [Mizuhopecten yessoensis]|uniref:Uncharacterized protein n=1 Tax=Mizuhopecten yessoensis TaxID=6573 RepID=A0A210R5W8_MIZYE|nr:uncharacterized protein LOC110447800 [Mizuhopecten yessoensis]XP_021349417.1 uncharacterized protein LOC110447800 [Mizuhopecten yessoensis]OWF56422.1 hypothetical protein KP79_PYT09584 [Mizuhopecten yessoensis]
MAGSPNSARSHSNATIDNSGTASPAASINGDVLSRINESYHESKANQIFRLLQDQENLNKVLTSKPSCVKLAKDDEDEIDDSLSEDSLKATEKRLSVRLSLHRQRGGRSKSSVGFYHNAEDISSDEDNEKTDEMAEQERQINTRVNRPKSSYVRRTTMCQSYGDSDDEPRPQVRPMSRCGVRSGDPRSRRMVLKETNYNNQQEVPFRNQVDADLDKDSVDGTKNYDKYANTRYAPTTGLIRQRSRIRGFCDTSMATDMSVSSSSTDNMNAKNNCQIQEETTVLSIDPPDSARESSPLQKHRRQQLKSARSNRPTSENVFLVRQRTESRLSRGPHTTTSRPKSEKTLVNASGNTKSLLTIDTSPNQGTTSSKTYQSQQLPLNTLTQPQRLQRESYDRKPQARPVSRRASLRAEGSGAVRSSTKNMSVYGGRAQAIGLMKLPPLDPAVSQRAERALVIPTGETCA